MTDKPTNAGRDWLESRRYDHMAQLLREMQTTIWTAKEYIEQFLSMDGVTENEADAFTRADKCFDVAIAELGSRTTEQWLSPANTLDACLAALECGSRIIDEARAKMRN